MAYYITTPALVDSSITLYYKGDNRWSDDASQKVTYETEEEANNLMVNPDGRNGGWSNATVVSE